MDKHHIIPRYIGGSNERKNIVKISRTCHIMWHFANWQLWRNKQDYVAYKGLAGSLSGDSLNRAKSSLAGLKAKREKLGLFALSESERKEISKRGGLKGGKVMSKYKWITNGQENSRILSYLEVPNGWKPGVTRKKPRKLKKNKFGNKSDWAAEQRKKGKELVEQRRKDLERIDINQRGAVTELSKLWGVSHTQARRIINKLTSSDC